MFDISRSFRIATLAAAGLILAAPATAGVLAHYSFNNAVTRDDSGNGLDLTAGSGGPTQVGGQFGSAADFNGSSFLYLNGAASNSAFNFGAGDFTLALWYESDGTSFSPLAGINSSDLDQGYTTWVNSPFLAGDMGDATAGVGTPRPTDGVFHHLVFQSLAGILRLYVDSILVGASISVPSDAVNSAFALGTRNISFSGAENHDGASQKLDGRLDEDWIFDHAMTQTEISNLYAFNNTTGQQIPEAASIALFGLGLIGLRFAGRRRRA